VNVYENAVDETGEEAVDAAAAAEEGVDEGVDEAEVGAAGVDAGEAEPTPPRTRWAAVVWGLFLGALAFAGIWMLHDRDRRDGIVDGVMALTPGTLIAVGLLAVGVLILVAGIGGLARRVQRRLRR